MAAAATLQEAAIPNELTDKLRPFHTFSVISLYRMLPAGVYPDSSEITIL